MTGADEEAGVVVMDDDEREMSLEVVEREPDGLDEIALVVALDQVGDGLRVGLGRERVAVGREALLELAVVLDDAVEDDRELVRGAAGERVCVLLGDAAVRGPARVAEARRRGRAVRSGARLQIVEGADRADVVETRVLEERDAGGVVAAVLQALEAVEQERLALTRSDVSDDPAHGLVRKHEIRVCESGAREVP